MIMACTKCGNPCPVGADFKDPTVGFCSSVKMRFDEPQQGEFADCWFVAALSAYLFKKWPNAPAKVKDKYSFPFYNGKRWVSVATSGNVCVTAQNIIYGAKEDVNGTIYSWPAVYEKAYAAFKEGKNDDPPSMQPYISIVGFSPLDCLVSLSGSNPKGFWTNTLTADHIFSIIQDKTIPETGESSSVGFPFVAWTTAGNPALGIKNNHAYSILGLAGGSNFIILRDPDLASAPYGQNVKWTYDDMEKGITEVDCSNNNKGIFAITPADFKASFEGFGYVQ